MRRRSRKDLSIFKALVIIVIFTTEDTEEQSEESNKMNSSVSILLLIAFCFPQCTSVSSVVKAFQQLVGFPVVVVRPVPELILFLLGQFGHGHHLLLLFGGDQTYALGIAADYREP